MDEISFFSRRMSSYPASQPASHTSMPARVTSSVEPPPLGTSDTLPVVKERKWIRNEKVMARQNKGG
jgi:hypothetical protein